MSKVLNSPFTSDPFSAPSAQAGAGCNTSGNAGCCDAPGDDTSVVKDVFYQETPALKMTPAALASPMGTAIPGIGHAATPRKS